MKRFPSSFLCLLVLLALVGCADPTTDKPKAVVNEPAPEPERPAEASKFVLAEGSSIGFVGSKVTGSHDGGFKIFEGHIAVVDNDPLKSSVEISIDATSLWADNERLTGHLKSADFFDVENHPTASFVSTAITADGEGFLMVGNLTLHGITKSVSFPASVVVGDDQVTATAEFAIKRFDFDLVYPGKTDDLIRDDVLIKLNLVAVPAGAEAEPEAEAAS
jgi:polyisoprenoid-binding protein YceI